MFGCGGLPKEVLKGRGTLPNALLQITGRNADNRPCAKYFFFKNVKATKSKVKKQTT